MAGEVRSLAQRSAQAAKGIKSLIGASVERVGSGTRLVEEAGASMGDIVGSVKSVTAIMGKLNTATRDQSDRIATVTHTLTELDRMTQQDADFVAQPSKASQALREQAQELNSVVGVFELQSGNQARG